MQLILYRGEIAGIYGATRGYLAPPYDSLPADHPDCRVVEAMLRCARDICDGHVHVPYGDELALFYARTLLIDTDAFCDRETEPDEALARHFNVPVDLIACKRRDLDLGLAAPRRASVG